MKKMSRKEEAFWKDLALRMTKYLGYVLKRESKRLRPCCSAVVRRCVVLNKSRYSFPYIVAQGPDMKSIVYQLCYNVSWLSGANKQKNIFRKLAIDTSTDGNMKEQHAIEAELAGFSDLVDTIKKGKLK